jgi:TonB family protein
MFDQITSGGVSGALRGSSMLVSIAVHCAFIAITLAFAYYKVHAPNPPEPVVVAFRSPPPPPPPLAGHRTRTPRETPKRRVTPKVPPTSIVQPKERPQQQPPDPPPEQSEAADDDAPDDSGAVGGTLGGVAGGVVGGQLGGQGEGPPVLLGAGMTRPVPSPACQPNKPATPEQARQMGITGLVLVEYTVHGDGRVDTIVLKNPSAPRVLFEAVKTWLEQCPFTPSIAGGQPVAVKIVQPFKFTQR